MKNCSQLPSQPFKRKLYLGLLDAKRLLKYDKVKLENHLSCKCPLKKKKKTIEKTCLLEMTFLTGVV